MSPTPVEVTKLSAYPLPQYARPGDAGCDGVANLTKPVLIPPGCRALIPLGIKVAIPEGYELQLRPRSGLALKFGVTLVNTPGTIDSGYRGEVGAILINHGLTDYLVSPGDRVCQLVLNQFCTIQWEPVAALSESLRGDGGFGHSGGGQ